MTRARCSLSSDCVHVADSQETIIAKTKDIQILFILE